MPFLFISSAEPPMSLWPAGFPGEAVRGGWARAKQDVMTHSLLCPVGAAMRSSLAVILGPPFLACKVQGLFSCPRLGGGVGIDGFLAPCTRPFPFHAVSRSTGQRAQEGAPLRAPQSPSVSASPSPSFSHKATASHPRAAGSAVSPASGRDDGSIR